MGIQPAARGPHAAPQIVLRGPQPHLKIVNVLWNSHNNLGG